MEIGTLGQFNVGANTDPLVRVLCGLHSVDEAQSIEPLSIFENHPEVTQLFCI